MSTFPPLSEQCLALPPEASLAATIFVSDVEAFHRRPPLRDHRASISICFPEPWIYDIGTSKAKHDTFELTPSTLSRPSFLVNDMIEVQRKISCDEDVGTKRKKKGAFSGVFIPTCENMWGVLIFLRFYHIVGEALGRRTG